MPEMITFNKRVLKTPYVVLMVVIGFAFNDGNWCLLLGVPLIYLGWVCAAPNLNLIDGFLPQLALVTSAVGSQWLGPTSHWIGMCCWLTWFLCSLELALRCEIGRTGS